MHPIAVTPGIARTASPALSAAVKLEDVKAHGPRCVLLVAAARSESDHLAVMLTFEVRISATGTPRVFSGVLSSISDARPQLVVEV
jgi:hypothetical protein